MNRVHVVVAPPGDGNWCQNPEQCTVTTTKPNTPLQGREYDGWIPVDYLVGQVKRDVARYWHLKASKYALYDTLGNRLADEQRLTFPNLHPAALELQKLKTPPKSNRESAVAMAQTDPFWIQNHLFDLFLFYALQNRHGTALRITCYQFKHLLQKATAKTVFQREQKLAFDKRAALAFRGALSNIKGSTVATGGLSFDEFLDALVNVACFMVPKVSSKELALEKLAIEHVIPYHLAEQSVGSSSSFSWRQMEVLMRRNKTKQLIQRFAKLVCYLATAYSANVGVAHRRCVLRFAEFHRFVHDVIPKTVSITPGDLCKIYVHCCRKPQSVSDPAYQSLGDRSAKEESSDRTRDTANLWGDQFVSGIGETNLSFQCDNVIEGLVYIALLAIPRLVKANERVITNFADLRPMGKLATQSIKALLHHVSNHLSAKSNYHAKSNAEFSRARVQFLVEFNKMHREDSLTDYVSNCARFLQERPPHQLQSSGGSIKNVLWTNQDDTDRATAVEIDFDADFKWDLASTDDGNSDSGANSPVSRTSSRQVDPRVLKELLEHEQTQLCELCNEADEIYAFLAGELQRQTLTKGWGKSDTVPQLLDIWVAAGEKYSQVIAHVEKSADLQATFLSRFGRSLYVFAVQILKSATKVYNYEDLFYVTNARAYSVEADLWHSSPAMFTLDLSLETLSLASGKLSQASEALSALVESAKVNDLENASDDGVANSGATTDGGYSDGEEEVTTASAYYDKYLSCVFHRANCIAAYADVLAHGKKVAVDYELGYCFEEENEHGPLGQPHTPPNERPRIDDRFFTSNIVLSENSSPGEFYWGANKMFRFLMRRSKCGPNFTRSRLLHSLAMTQFKLATHLPRGCVAEKQLLEDALRNLSLCKEESSMMEPGVLRTKHDYIRAIIAVRQKFFLAERLEAANDEAKRDPHPEQAERLTPFYRFVLAAAFREFDLKNTGLLRQPELTLLSKDCGRRKVCDDSMAWLLRSFDSQEGGLTERGFLQYFAWIAEAEPVAFCDILDLLTAKHTGVHNISISAGNASLHSQKPSSLKATTLTRNPTMGLGGVRERGGLKRAGLADCIVVLGAKTSKAVGVDIGQTSSPSEIRLEPEVVDVLPPRARLPDELSKFCFPDDMYFSTELFPPRAFDIVLTDIKGELQYGSCLHFFEEKHPVDVLALISAGQRGRTANLPSWISLKDIQQGQTKWKCFVPKCLCVLSRSPLFQTFQSFLESLYQLARSPSSSLSLESLVFNFLERIPQPSADTTHTVLRLGDQARLLSGCAATSPQFLPTEVDFTILFQCLSPENILKVYGYLLTEKKVVLYSSSRAILAHVAETLRALLHPFECQQVYIPVLPLSLIEFVCAPVPFFMGIHSDHRIEKLTTEGVIVVDLTKNEVHVPQHEVLPSLPESKSKKLLGTLRKLSAWPASQNSRYRFGQNVECKATSMTASYYPSKASHAEVAQLVQHHDELAGKWRNIQLLFATFATRLLKDVRKHCTKSPDVPNNGGPSSEVVVFDSRSFLAVNPTYREFSVHLFQTQLFQRALENIWTFSSDTPSLAESEPNWRTAVRSKGVLRKPSDSSDDTTKPQRRRIVHAPLPPRKETSKTHALSELAPMDGFPMLNGHLYEELLDDFISSGDTREPSSSEFSTVSPRPSTPTLSSEFSSTSVLTLPSFHDGDADALQLVNAARKRLEEKRLGDTAE